jgi:hypothetical protein
MKLRGWINRNSELVTVISVFFLVFSLVVLVKNAPKQGRTITRAYYYDVVTGKLFTGPVGDTPPIPTPSGSIKNGVFAGVRANVFTCKSCDDEKSRVIGYLETYTQEAREALDTQRTMAEANIRAAEVNSPDSPPTTQIGPDENEVKLLAVIAGGRLIASPADTEKWFRMESDEGMELVNAAMTDCPGGRYATQCYPED